VCPQRAHYDSRYCADATYWNDLLLGNLVRPRSGWKGMLYKGGVYLQVAAVSLLGLTAGHAQNNRDAHRISERVAAAKKTGQQKVDMRASYGQMPDVQGLNEALSASTAVLGVPVAKETVVERDVTMFTWYKVLVREQLNPRAPAPIVQPLDAIDPSLRPKTLLPLAENEILVSKPGGSLEIDGVTVTASDPEFPDPLLNHTYLMLLSESEEKVAVFEFGAASLYEVVGDSLIPAGNRNHPVVKDMKGLHSNSLAALKTRLKTIRPTSR
jgi:hypothetical protein